MTPAATQTRLPAPIASPGRRTLRSRAAMFAAVSMLAATLAGCAVFGGGAPAKVANGALVDSKGMSLYTFAKDADGKSACVAGCAKNWPPLMASASDRPAGGYTIITRDDGSLQWAYKGKPLYTWIKDVKPGDRTGDGWNKVWSLARP
jgi:predicted lipoprotein with Yx(FWY)xxD motif